MPVKANVIRIACITPHFGEEPVLNGPDGAGAVFFSGCNLRCVFCQNWQISHHRSGEMLMSPEQLAGEMLKLQETGCHNIDLVSPPHQVKPLRFALELAREDGLSIPVIYNSNGIDGLEALRSLKGLVDIYLPDLKYSEDHIARDLSGAPRYVSRARTAIKEMFRQVGHLYPADEEALAQRGLIIRMLVLPDNLSGCRDSLAFIAEEIGTETWLSLMAQYNPQPLFDSGNEMILGSYPELARRVTVAEYESILQHAQKLGFENIFIQECETAVEYGSPDFQNENPFEWQEDGI